MKYIYQIIIFSFLLLSCKENTKVEQKIEEPQSNGSTIKLNDAQAKNAAIETSKIGKSIIGFTTKVSGIVVVPPQNIVSINTPLNGQVSNINVAIGSFVKKGQLLAKIKDQVIIDLQQEYLSAQNKYAFAEKDFQRQKLLNDSKASSDKVMQMSKSEMQQQEIIIHALSEKLKMIHIAPEQISPQSLVSSINIYSTITGNISKVFINSGKYVTASESLFEIINTDKVSLKLKVFEKDLRTMKLGQQGIAFASNSKDKYAFKIDLISKDVANDGMAEVFCNFNNKNIKLMAGTFMNAEITMQSSNTNSLPEDAVVSFEGKTYVFVKTGSNQYEMTEVTIGQSNNGNVEVLNLTEFNGKDIVTSSAYTLLMALKNVE